MGGNDVIGHVKVLSSNVSARRSAFTCGCSTKACMFIASRNYRVTTTGNPTDKEPKLSDLDVTRRNPDIVRDSEGPSGTAGRALFPAGGTGLTTPGGHGPFGAVALRACPFPVP
jgi:hypothetical protein